LHLYTPCGKLSFAGTYDQVDTTGQTELTALLGGVGQTREQISEGVAISWMRRDMSLDVAGNRLPRYRGRMINDLAFEDRAEDNQPMIAGATFDFDFGFPLLDPSNLLFQRRDLLLQRRLFLLVRFAYGYAAPVLFCTSYSA
jgi:hypothetical protein